MVVEGFWLSFSLSLSLIVSLIAPRKSEFDFDRHCVLR